MRLGQAQQALARRTSVAAGYAGPMGRAYKDDTWEAPTSQASGTASYVR